MNVNANKLRDIRDSVKERLDDMNIHEPKGVPLTLLTTLNVLLRVADNSTNLDEVETLTRAGRTLVENYEKIYEEGYAEE